MKSNKKFLLFVIAVTLTVTVIAFTAVAENMTDDDKIVHLTEVMCNTEEHIISRKTAYDELTELMPNYYDFDKKEYKTNDEKLKNTIDLYLNFDYNLLVMDLQEYNLNEFSKMVEELSKIKRSLNTYKNRKACVDSIDEFLSENSDYILKNEKYNDLMVRVKKVNDEILIENQIIDFIIIMDHFETSTTIYAQQEYFNNADAMIKEGLDTSLVGTAGFDDFTKYYYRYIELTYTFKYLIFDENSRKIISCIDMIREYDTEQEWIDNYDYVEKYVLIARKMIAENNYNPDYAGFSEAFTIYENINNYFYSESQKKHIEKIKNEFYKFNNSDKYIERLGICANIDIYIKNNDIDQQNSEIAELLEKNEIHKEQLMSEKEEYIIALRNNTKKFIEVINDLKKCEGYLLKKEKYTEAEIYYYNMNIGTKEAQDAIKAFDECTVILNKIEVASKKFIETTCMMKTSSENELFSLLVDGFKLKKDISDEYTGVPEAIAEYNKYYDKYTNWTNGTNNEISETISAVASLRVCVKGDEVISIIKNKFYK